MAKLSRPQLNSILVQALVILCISTITFVLSLNTTSKKTSIWYNTSLMEDMDLTPTLFNVLLAAWLCYLIGYLFDLLRRKMSKKQHQE